MEAVTIVLRTLLIYFVVLGIMRIMGKREIGKLSIFDLVVSIMIAEMAVVLIEDMEKSLWEGLLPMGILVILQISIAYITLKNRTLRRMIEGVPSVLIFKGKLNRNEMKKIRYNLDDLLLQLRENKITNIADVEFAMLETSGKLTVIDKNNMSQNDSKNKQQGGNSGTVSQNPFDFLNTSGNSGMNKESMFQKIRYEGLPLPLVLDGKVQDDNLKKIGQNRFWLKNEIQKKGAKEFKDIFVCTIDHRGNLYLDQKRTR